MQHGRGNQFRKYDAGKHRAADRGARLALCQHSGAAGHKEELRGHIDSQTSEAGSLASTRIVHIRNYTGVSYAPVVGFTLQRRCPR